MISVMETNSLTRNFLWLVLLRTSRFVFLAAFAAPIFCLPVGAQTTGPAIRAGMPLLVKAQDVYLAGASVRAPSEGLQPGALLPDLEGQPQGAVTPPPFPYETRRAVPPAMFSFPSPQVDVTQPPVVPTPAEVAPAEIAAPDLSPTVPAINGSLFPLVMDGGVRRYVMAYLDHFAGLRESAGRSLPFIPEMAALFRARGLPGDFVYLAFAESAFTRVGAGPWQFTRTTAERFGLNMNEYVDERRDPIKSTRAAADYLAALYSQVGDWRLAIVGWNTGEGAVADMMERRGSRFDRLVARLPHRTRALLNRFMAVAFIARHVSGLGFQQLDVNVQKPYSRIVVAGGTSLFQVAATNHTDVETLRWLNPALLQDMVPPYSTSYELLVPQSPTVNVVAASNG